MAKTNWQMDETIMPTDMNQIGMEINELKAEGSATDDRIGDRTISDTTAPAGNTGKITSLFGWLGHMIKRITGKANWYTAPAIDLETVAARLNQSVSTAASPSFDGLLLKAGESKDHVYMSFFADSEAQSTRSGWLGFGGAGATQMSLVNEMPNGNIELAPNGTGIVVVSGKGEVLTRFGYGIGGRSSWTVDANAIMHEHNGIRHNTPATFTGSPHAGTAGNNQGYLWNYTWGDSAGTEYAYQEHVNVNGEINKHFRVKVDGVWLPWQQYWNSANHNSDGDPHSQYLRKSGGTFFGNGTSTIVNKADNSGRLILVGGTDTSTNTGAIISFHGKDYGGAGASGDIYLVPVAGRKILRNATHELWDAGNHNSSGDPHGQYMPRFSGLIDDFNTTLRQGYYQWNDGTANAPIAGTFGVLEVFVSGGGTHNNASNWIWQIARSTNNGWTKWRYKVNNTGWSGWHDYLSSHTHNSTGDPHTQYLLKAGGTIDNHLVVSKDFVIADRTLERAYRVAVNNGVANQKVDILLGNITYWASIEVEITGVFGFSNAGGVIKKQFSFGCNPNNQIYENSSRFVEALGNIVHRFTVGDIIWDSGLSQYKIQIACLDGAANTIGVRVKVMTASEDINAIRNNLKLGSVYTSDASILHQATVNFRETVKISSYAVPLVMEESDTGSYTGLWRFVTDGNLFRIDRNTHPDRQFLSVTTPFEIGQDDVLRTHGKRILDSMSSVFRVNDTRSMGQRTPSTYTSQAKEFEFTDGSLLGIPGSSASLYYTVESTKPWTDQSGGPVIQRATHTISGKRYTRKGNLDTNTWGAWEEDVTAANTSISDPNNYFASANVEGALAELFQSASNGKSAIAAAITGKGQPAAATETFDQLAAKIRDIDIRVQLESLAGKFVAGTLSYTTSKKVTVGYGSLLRVTFDIAPQVNDDPSQAAIFINGVLHWESPVWDQVGFTSHTRDITFNTGDAVELRVRNTDSGRMRGVVTRNFRVFTIPATSPYNGSVDID